MKTEIVRLGDYNDYVILARKNDRYVNATQMCKANGKQLGHYLENKNTKAYLKALSAAIGIPIADLVQVRIGVPEGGAPQDQGTWVHPRVATHLAQWCSAQFAVLVSGWLDELLTTGRVEIAPPVAPSLSLVKPAEERLALLSSSLPNLRLALTVGGKIDPRDEVLLADVYRNVSLQIVGSDPVKGAWISAVDRAVELGYPRLPRGEDGALGRAVAEAYKRANEGKEPEKHKQTVDGRVVGVNGYTMTDLPDIDPAIHEFFACRKARAACNGRPLFN